MEISVTRLPAETCGTTFICRTARDVKRAHHLFEEIVDAHRTRRSGLVIHNAFVVL